MLLLLDVKCSYTHNMVMPQRKFDSIVQIEAMWDVRIWLLRRGKS